MLLAVRKVCCVAITDGRANVPLAVSEGDQNALDWWWWGGGEGNGIWQLWQPCLLETPAWDQSSKLVQ